MTDQTPHAAPSFAFVEIEMRGTAAIIRLNRPDLRNAINDQMRQELIAAFDWADRTADVRAVILTGAGKGFCFGGDIGGMRAGWMRRKTRSPFNGWTRQKTDPSRHRGHPWLQQAGHRGAERGGLWPRS